MSSIRLCLFLLATWQWDVFSCITAKCTDIKAGSEMKLLVSARWLDNTCFSPPPRSRTNAQTQAACTHRKPLSLFLNLVWQYIDRLPRYADALRVGGFTLWDYWNISWSAGLVHCTCKQLKITTFKCRFQGSMRQNDDGHISEKKEVVRRKPN